MKHSPSYVLLTVALTAASLSCRNQSVAARSELRTDAASMCDTNSVQLYLELPAEGGYFLNKVPFDSVRLVGWFREKLTTRAPVQRLVFIHPDSPREAELQWLIPAIVAAGGGAYQPDSFCMRPVPSVLHSALLSNGR